MISGNDVFVTSAWGSGLGDADGKITFLADPTLALGFKLDLTFDATKIFGWHRHKRSAILVEDGVVKNLWVEPDSTGVSSM